METNRFGWEPLAYLRGRAIHPDQQRRIHATGGTRALAFLASHPSLDPAVAAVMADTAGETIRARLAANPATTGDVLAAYAASRSRLVRAGAAANPNLDAAAQGALAAGRSALVRRELAGNPALTPAAVLVLAGDRQTQVLVALASNPRIGGVLMAQFADHPHPRVRNSLAGNPELPSAVQHRLTKLDPAGLERLAANPALDPALQPFLAGHRAATVRATLAGRPDLRSDVQETLAADAASDVRVELAGSPGLVGHVRRTLTGGADDEVWRAVLRRRDADRADLQDVLLGMVRQRTRSLPVLGCLPGSGRPEDWDRGFLDDPMTGPGAAARTGRFWVVRTALAHPDPLVRIGGLLNGLAEGRQIEELLGDPVPEVAYAARMTVLRRM